MKNQVELSSNLTLRKFGIQNRLEEECLPENLQPRMFYKFFKKRQRHYLIGENIPLLENKGNQQLSKPLASIRIMEVTHSMDLKTLEIYTKGKYYVSKVYNVNN